jgi:hypothetical protein
MIATIKEEDDAFFESATGTKKPEEVKPTKSQQRRIEVMKKSIVLKNSSGEVVEEEDYFFGGTATESFNKDCGMPVDREDLLEVFHKIFSPEDNFLFYKATNKEVYLVIVPLKYSSSVSKENGSFPGTFQAHAMSFINEGSVNMDTLKTKLKKILPFVNFKDR